MPDTLNAPTQIALIQSNAGDDREANHRKTVDQVRLAANRGAKIICTQELYQGHYFCQTEDHKYFQWAEEIPGPTTDEWQSIASELGVVIVASLFEKRARGLFHNSAVVIDADGSMCGVYRKSHIPDDPQFMEKFYFAPGDLGYKVFPTAYGNVGVLICWDQWFPEAARITALMGADIIFYPTAIGWLPAEKQQYGKQQVDAWMTVQRSHAIANGCYIAAANRIGLEVIDGTKGIEFWGNSFICDPAGNLTAIGSSDKDEIIIGEVDPEKITESRTHWPYFRDRRIDTYSPILKQYIDQ